MKAEAVVYSFHCVVFLQINPVLQLDIGAPRLFRKACESFN